jgi:hypothetical protein
MGCNIECELIKRIRRSQGFAMQADESTDITGLSVLLAFLRHKLFYSNQVEEEMLTCKRLPTHATGEEIFNLISCRKP